MELLSILLEWLDFSTKNCDMYVHKGLTSRTRIGMNLHFKRGVLGMSLYFKTPFKTGHLEYDKRNGIQQS